MSLKRKELFGESDKWWKVAKSGRNLRRVDGHSLAVFQRAGLLERCD